MSSEASACRIANILREPGSGDFLIEEDCYVFAIDNSEDHIHVPCVVVSNHTNQLINAGNETFQLVFNEEEEKDDRHEVETANNEGVTWPEEPTKLLICLYSKYKPMVEQGKLKTLRKMWEKLKFDMAQHGHMYSIIQIENKWKSLERAFKAKMENKGKTGRGRKHCPYEKELSEVLLKRHSINPPYTLGSNGNEGSTNVECAEANGNAGTPTKRRRLRSNPILNELQELRKAIAEKNKNKLETEKIKTRQRDEMITELKKRNILLDKLLNIDADAE